MILKVSFSNRSDNYDIVTLVDEKYYISDSDNCTEVEAIEDFINYSKVDNQYWIAKGYEDITCCYVVGEFNVTNIEIEPITEKQLRLLML